MVITLWWWSTPLLTDHSWPWSTMAILGLIGCEITIIWPWSLHGHDGQCHYWLTMFDHGRPWPVSYGQFMVNDSQSCIRPWSTMVNHGHLEAYRPWNDHHLTMVITWLMMVMVLLTDHGQPWLTMVNILDLTTIDHHMTMTIDHGRPWSTMVIWRLIDHEMTIIWPWSLHGWWWSWYYWLTMVNHGWPWSIYRIWLPLTIIWPWLLTKVDHGHDHRSILQTWSTMVRPWSIDGHFMVDHGQWPWSTMVKPWSTMVWPWSCCKGGQRTIPNGL